MSDAADNLGLDKDTRNQERRDSAALAAAEPPPLDPAFPYRAEPFDPAFFGLRPPPRLL